MQRELPSLHLSLGNTADTVTRDIDHLAAADVLITANSAFSLLAATFYNGVKVIHPDCKYIMYSGGISRKVVASPSGDFDDKALRRMLRNLATRHVLVQPVANVGCKAQENSSIYRTRVTRSALKLSWHANVGRVALCARTPPPPSPWRQCAQLTCLQRSSRSPTRRTWSTCQT